MSCLFYQTVENKCKLQKCAFLFNPYILYVFFHEIFLFICCPCIVFKKEFVFFYIMFFLVLVWITKRVKTQFLFEQ